jgi:putative tributyrin esterase
VRRSPSCPARARAAVGAVALALAGLAPWGALSAQAPPHLPEDPRVVLAEVRGSLPEARPVVVLLPADYTSSGRRYPVLYLLHGLWGSHRDWLTRTDLLRATAGLPLIVVLPDAGDSWYVNSATEPEQRFEDYIGRDVVAWADATFRTLPRREARFIAGLSMGGFGAVRLGLKYPARFAVAGSFSGAFGGLRQDPEHESIPAAFGPPGSPPRAERHVIERIAAAEPASLPYIYLDCGTADRLLAGSREVAAALQARGAAYEYHEVPGAHDWAYWDRRLPALLRLLAPRLREPDEAAA